MNKADIVIKSSNIYIGKGNEILSGFIAIKNDKIIYIGENDAINEFLSNKTKIIDCCDKLVLPGFHDSHLHFFMSGLYADKKVKVSFTDKSEEECVDGLKDIADLNSTLSGASDIQKQLAYSKSAYEHDKNLLKKQNVFNAFIIPYCSNDDNYLKPIYIGEISSENYSDQLNGKYVVAVLIDTKTLISTYTQGDKKGLEKWQNV